MIYANSAGKLLPLPKLKAIGIESARGDGPNNECTLKRLTEFRTHYGKEALWCSPAYHQTDKEAAALVKRCYQAGIRHFNFENEPEGVLHGQKPRAPKQAADRSKRIRDACPQMKLYGPSTGIWLPGFIEDFLEAGGTTDVIAWNAYDMAINDIPQCFLSCMRDYGLPGFITELSFSLLPEWRPDYPVQCGQVQGFIEAKKALGHLSWTLYPVPDPGGPQAKDALFLWDRNYDTTTPTYEAIKKALASPSSDAVDS